MGKIVECVPNFSEGRDKNIINTITREIEGVNEVELLDVDLAKRNDTVNHLAVYHLLSMTAGQRPGDFQKIWEH